MRLVQRILIGAAVAMVGSASIARAQTDSAPRPYVSMQTLVDGISKSATPSDTIAAYATAYRETGDAIAVQRAFVNKMIDFGMPEMAAAQAEELAGRTNDGVPFGVMAFAAARADKLDEAVRQIATAVRVTPMDPFIVRTAGQIMAWYDARKAGANFTAEVQKDAEEVRDRLKSRKTFKDAYEKIYEPMQELYSGGESGTELVLGNTDLATLGAFSGSSRTGFSNPMALFYAAPFALFPGYGYWYQPIGADVYYYQNWWRRSVGTGRLFPFPSIDRDTRYLKLPSGGFALVGEDGTALFNPIAAGSLYAPGYYNGYFAPGYYGSGYYGPSYYAPPIYRGGGGGGGRGLRTARSFGNQGFGRSNNIPPVMSSQNDFRVGPSAWQVNGTPNVGQPSGPMGGGGRQGFGGRSGGIGGGRPGGIVGAPRPTPR